jgi:alkylation response protein AidB-like acyl-CoA dehydrogenase
MQQIIFNQEQARFDVSTGALTVGLGMVGPTVLRWGTEQQKSRYLSPMLAGAEMWCQLFSEPAAGSDLAGLSTRADHGAGGWVVNGQKVWTSLAQHSDRAILLARTNRAAPKHRGITYFLVDMRTEGIEVRPLRQIDGVAHFNEVFLTDVRIPDDQVVGDVDDGWKVAQTTLQSERLAIGGGESIRFDDVRGVLAATGTGKDPLLRQQVAAAFTRFELLRYLGYRVQTAISQGRPPGPESSVMKLAYSEHVAATADLLLLLEGVTGTLGAAAAPAGGFSQQQFLTQWSSRIGGGTDEIQRNIISERVLGLPREPDPARDAPVQPAGTSGR